MALRAASPAEEKRLAVSRVANERHRRSLAFEGIDRTTPSVSRRRARQTEAPGCGSASPQDLEDLAIGKLHDRLSCGNVPCAFATAPIQSVATRASRWKNLFPLVARALRRFASSNGVLRNHCLSADPEKRFSKPPKSQISIALRVSILFSFLSIVFVFLKSIQKCFPQRCEWW
jgi:hypothetical protein